MIDQPHYANSSSNQYICSFISDNFNRGHRKNFMHSLVGYSLACYIM